MEVLGKETKRMAQDANVLAGIHYLLDNWPKVKRTLVKYGERIIEIRVYVPNQD